MKTPFPAKALGLTLLTIACLSVTACQKGSTTGADTPPPEVGVMTIQPQTLTITTELPGRTSPYLISEVRPQVSGILLNRQFEEGSQVRAGQVLYQIDPAPYQAALNRAEASLSSAKLQAERYEKLIAVHAVSQQQYDDARSQYLQAKATTDAARIDLGYTRITAPIPGQVGRSTVTQGALVTAGQATALATVQQLDPIYVDIVQPSLSLLQFKDDLNNGRLKRTGKNQAAVQLRLEDGRTYEHPGKLQFSEVSVDQDTGSVTLRAVFPNPEGTLLPGMFVRALLEQGTDEHALLVPQRSVSRDTQGKAFVNVLDKDDVVEQRSLILGRNHEDQWLVSEGLVVGDRVVVDGTQNVRPGIKVKAVPATAAAIQPTAESTSTAPATK